MSCRTADIWKEWRRSLGRDDPSRGRTSGTRNALWLETMESLYAAARVDAWPTGQQHVSFATQD